jgi:TP901 family phage tail tape measure protein
MSDVNANIGVHIDTSAALAELKALQRQLAQFHSQVSKSSAAAAAAQKNLQTNLLNSINATGKFRAQMGVIRTSTESFTNSLEKNKFSMREYFRYGMGATRTFGKLFKSEFDTIGKVAEERVKRMQTQYIKMGRDASGAMKSIAITPTTLNMKDYATQTAIAAQKQALLNQLLKQGSTNLLNFGKNTQWAGRQLMVGFTIPLAYFGTAAAKTFMDLEAQALKFRRVYGDMFTTTGETEKALSDIEKLAEQFTKYGVAVSKTMEMAASAAAMGKTGAELTAQVANATRLAVLGNVEQEQALETTISLTNAFGLAADQLAGKINFLNAVENQTVTAIEDLTIAIPKAGPVVEQLGGSVEDLAFFLTAMREGGINASESANALKSGLASLINPTKKASQMLADMGINIKDIVERNKGQLRSTVVEFAKALDTLDPLNRARAIEQLFGKFQFARLSTLFQNVTKDGSQAARVLDLAGASVEQLAILSERELKAVEDAVGTNFKEAVEKLKVSIAPIGKEFLKAITPVAKFLGDLFEKFNNLSDGSKKFIVILTTLVGLVGPTLLMTFGLVANGAANIIKLFILMRQGFLKLSGNTTNLAQQTQYMTTEQMEAATVAASLNQAHSRLTQQFTVETSAVLALRNAYVQATTAAIKFAAANPGMMMPGFKGMKGPGAQKFADGTTGVTGGQKGKDSVLSVLTPGEAVIPEPIAQDERFKPLVEALVTGKIRGYAVGTASVGDDNSVTFENKKFSAVDRKTAQALADEINAQLEASSKPGGVGKDAAAKTILNRMEGLQTREGRVSKSRVFKHIVAGKNVTTGSGSNPQIQRLRKVINAETAKFATQEAAGLKQSLQTAGLSQKQIADFMRLQESHILDPQNKAVKWTQGQVLSDYAGLNNYLNRAGGSTVGSLVNAISNDPNLMSQIGYDKKQMRQLMYDYEFAKLKKHPTSTKEFQSIARIADLELRADKTGIAGRIIPGGIADTIHQAKGVAALASVRTPKFYQKLYKSLIQLGPGTATRVGRGKIDSLGRGAMSSLAQTVRGKIAAAKGELYETKDGRRGVVTGQTGTAKPSGRNVTGSPRDTRVMSTQNIKRIFPYGVKGPRYAGAIEGYEEGSAVGPRGLQERRDSQAEELKKSIDKNTASQDDGTKTQEKTSKELKQEQRFNKTQRMNAYAGPMAMAAGTGAMVAAMAGAPQTMTNFLFGISAVSGLLPLLMNPIGAVIAGLSLAAVAIYKYNSDLKKAREEGVAFAKAISMSSQKIKDLSVLAGTVSATEEARKRRENIAAGSGEGQRRFGQGILESDFGKQLLGDINTQAKAGLDNKEISKNIATNLGQAVVQGVITTEQARSIASALGEKLGSYEIPALISGNLVQLLGPEGQNLFDSPLDVALRIKSESLANTQNAFEQALNTAAANSGFAGAMTPDQSYIQGVVENIKNLLDPTTLFDEAKENQMTTKANSAAVQLGAELIGQNQQLVDGLNRQYDIKLKSAKTEQEIKDIQDERKASIDRINAANAQTLKDVLTMSKNLSADEFTKSINSAIDSLYKDSSDAIKTFVQLAKDSLNKLEDSPFKKTIQLGFASGELQASTISKILEYAAADKEIQSKINFLITKEGFANTDLLMQLFAKTGADAQTVDIMLNYVNTNSADFDKDLAGVAAIANMQGTYGVTLNLKTNGTQQILNAQTALSAIEKLPDKLDLALVTQLAGTDPAVFGPIKDNWKELSEGKDTINKNLVVNYSIGSVDPNIVAAAKAEGVTVAEYLAKGFVAPTPTPTTNTPPTNNTKGRDTTLDELLKRLKFIRKASIDAEGGVKELMRITSGKGIAKFGGVMQQLMAGPKGGANREFIAFLEQMDNKTRKTYMSVKNGEVVLTKQGKALKEAFNEKVIGEFQVAQVQTIQDTLAQRAALLKLKSAGVDNATALEMVADASLAVAINSKNIDSTELQNMARNAKKAKDEVADLNLEVQNLGTSIQDRIKNLNTTIAALQAAKGAGITSQELLQYIASNQALADQIARKGINDPVVQDILKNQPKISDLEGAVDGLVDPLKKIQSDFDKARDKAEKFYTYLEKQANIAYQNWLKNTKTTFEGVEYSISDAIDKIKEKIDGYQEEIGDAQRNVELEFDRPMEALREEIDDIQRQIELQFDRPIEKLQNEIEGLQRQIELQFDRPIQALQDESGRLSNDLTLMDRAADAINKKYDAQEEALNKISDLNKDIIAQEKQRISLADAITQGDISAAAQAAQDMRAAAAESASQRAGGVLQQAREAEIAGLRSAGGMTRAQIEERQFQIGQQVYQLEQGRAAIQAQILIKQDAIYKLEQDKLPLLESIRVKEDAIYALQEKKEAALIKIRDLEDKVYKLSEDILEPLEQRVQKQEKILKAELDAIQAQRDKWDQAQLAIDAATIKADGFAGKLDDAETSMTNILSDYNKIVDKVVTIMINEVRNVSYAGGAGKEGANELALKQKAYDAELADIQKFQEGSLTRQELWEAFKKKYPNGRPMMYGGKVKPMQYGGRIGSDFVPAMLTPGEFVVNRAATKQFGPLLSSINNMKYPSMAGGGSFSSPSYRMSGGSAPINIPLQNTSVSYPDNSSTVYNYNVGITVGGTNATPESIANIVLSEIRSMDSQKIRGHRAS